MFTRSTLQLTSAALCGALFLSGCANQLPQRSEHEERFERKVLEHNLQIDVGEPALLKLPQRRVRIQEQKTVEVTVIEVSRRYDRYTPYQVWRELYEVPMGAVAIVGGIGANVLNVVLLGSLPDNVTKDLISYGFAGLNPFMNIESNGRSQQNLARLEERRLEPRTEYLSQPWAERTVQVQAADQQHELQTDRQGILRLNLLDSPFADQDTSRINRLVIRVEDPQSGTRSDASLLVSRTLRGKLQEAHDLIYNDLEADDVTQWVHRVSRLAELGLEEEASELEQSLIELTRHDPELQESFLKALISTTGRQALAPAGQ